MAFIIPGGTETEDNNIWDCEGSSSAEDEPQARGSVQLTKEDLQPVPFPRLYGSIKIKFTPRAFPTPQRESQIEEEQAVRLFFFL